MEARDEAEVDEVPGEECSARMVVRWAIQELKYRSVDQKLCRWLVQPLG